MDSNQIIDRDKISLPKIEITPRAWQEINLIIENDFTLKGKFLRVLISGKGCDGFTYSIGFMDPNEDDFYIPIKEDSSEIEILMDPFTAFYLQNCSINFVQDLENGNEGFVVKNNNQTSFHGKFWKKSEEKVPPLFDKGESNNNL